MRMIMTSEKTRVGLIALVDSESPFIGAFCYPFGHGLS